jgi:hypothetical protein
VAMSSARACHHRRRPASRWGSRTDRGGVAAWASSLGRGRGGESSLVGRIGRLASGVVVLWTAQMLCPCPSLLVFFSPCKARHHRRSRRGGRRPPVELSSCRWDGIVGIRLTIEAVHGARNRRAMKAVDAARRPYLTWSRVRVKPRWRQAISNSLSPEPPHWSFNS